jgi:hypothetical protein
MKKVILQLWEESEKDGVIQPDGCSLHFDEKSLKQFISEFYSSRTEDHVPDFYERVIGNPIEVDVVENIYSIISEMKSIRIQQYEMNNLIGLKEINIDDI